jgi:hypothetical protein
MNEQKVVFVLRDIIKKKPLWNSAYEFRRSAQNSLFLLQEKGVDLGLKFENTVQGVFSKELSVFLLRNLKTEGIGGE